MIRTVVAQEGFEGILLPGNGSKDKVMIVMSGSNGGMMLTKQCAAFYDRNGIPALALALFATKGTQPFLDRVPVEYVENAIKWLKKRGFRKIGIDGMSKGSEIALIAASLFPDISCVIARVPSHFVSEGLIGYKMKKGPSGTSCWSYHGRQFAYAPYKIRTFNVPKMLIKEKELHMIDFNREKDVTAESLIPIENIKAPVLMLSSKHDTVWPSYESATYMEHRFEKTRFEYRYRHVAYENMSHALLTERRSRLFIGWRSKPKGRIRRDARKTEKICVKNCWTGSKMSGRIELPKRSEDRICLKKTLIRKWFLNLSGI